MRRRPLLLAGGVLAGAAAATGVLLATRPRPPRPRELSLRGGPYNVAHRGGSGVAPENTLAAFRQAVDEWNVPMIELDVHASADGHCVVIHDPTVDRTTDATGNVAELTLNELRQLDAGYRFTPDGGQTYPFRGQGVTIPTIDEVLEALPDTRVIVEVKAAAAQRPLLDAVRRAGASGRVVAAGQHDADRKLFFEHTGPLSASGEQCSRFYVLHRMHLGGLWCPPADGVHVPEKWGSHSIVSPRFVRDLHAHGIGVYVWTVNDPADMERLLDWGVDGILTDRPDLMDEVLRSRGLAPSPSSGRGGSG